MAVFNKPPVGGRAAKLLAKDQARLMAANFTKLGTAPQTLTLSARPILLAAT